MRFCFLMLCFLLPCMAWATDFRLMVYGDSLSAGYKLSKKDAFYAQLEEKLKSKGYAVTVINASRSGETTAGGLKKQASAINQKPDAVLLELGVNDAIRNISIDTTHQNLKAIIEAFQKNKIPVLLIGMQSPPNRSSAYRQQFVQMYRDLANQYDLILYPFFMKGIFNTGFGSVLPASDKVLSDSVHPNAKGVQVMVDNILPTIERFLVQQGVSSSL